MATAGLGSPAPAANGTVLGRDVDPARVLNNMVDSSIATKPGADALPPPPPPVPRQTSSRDPPHGEMRTSAGRRRGSNSNLNDTSTLTSINMALASRRAQQQGFSSERERSTLLRTISHLGKEEKVPVPQPFRLNDPRRSFIGPAARGGGVSGAGVGAGDEDIEEDLPLPFTHAELAPPPDYQRSRRRISFDVRRMRSGSLSVGDLTSFAGTGSTQPPHPNAVVSPPLPTSPYATSPTAKTPTTFSSRWGARAAATAASKLRSISMTQLAGLDKVARREEKEIEHESGRRSSAPSIDSRDTNVVADAETSQSTYNTGPDARLSQGSTPSSTSHTHSDLLPGRQYDFEGGSRPGASHSAFRATTTGGEGLKSKSQDQPLEVRNASVVSSRE